MDSLTLSAAQRLILNIAQPGKTETVPLGKAFRRIAAKPLKAKIPVPHFNRSLMDGYAVRASDLDFNGPEKEIYLKVVGEIPAGRTDSPQFKNGETIRIMTGGAVPKNTSQIIPKENCRLQGSTLIISPKKEPKTWVQQQGAIIRRNQTIAKAGEPLSVEHIAMLAKAGVSSINVFKPARASVLSTGSELVLPGTAPESGQVVSANILQFGGLLEQNACILENSSTVKDKTIAIMASLARQLATRPDVIITTGGMGPGKYDLIPTAFKEFGFEILYRSLQINPGKNTIMGLLDSTLVFALPGPPPAARILFYELVQPALRRIMGAARPLPKRRTAILQKSIRIGRPGFLSLLSGRTENKNGQVIIRRTKRHEASDAVMLIPSHRRQVKAGEKISYHQTCCR